MQAPCILDAYDDVSTSDMDLEHKKVVFSDESRTQESFPMLPEHPPKQKTPPTDLV